MKKSETKRQKEKRKKKEMQEDLDYLKQVDKPGGRKFVVDKLKDDEKKEKDVQDTIKNYLETSSQARFTYRAKLNDYALSRLEQLDYPDGWEFYSIPTDGTRVKIFTKWFKSEEGILFVLKDKKGNVYTRGIKTTQDPEYDVNAVNVLVTQVENTVDSAKGILLSDRTNGHTPFKRTKSGIYVENE